MMNSTKRSSVSQKSGHNRLLAVFFSLTIVFSSLVTGIGITDEGFDVNPQITDSPSSNIRIIVPNGVDVWKGGDVIDIEWETPDDVEFISNSINIYYSIDNGLSWVLIGENEINDGTFTWTLPHVTTEECLVKVLARDRQGIEYYDVCDSVFVIDSTMPSIKVLRPNGKEVWRGGTVQDINWAADDNYLVPQDTISIFYTINGGLHWTLIAANEPNDGTYAWTVPSENSKTCQVKIITTDAAGNQQWDRNDRYFTISDTLVLDGIGDIPYVLSEDQENYPLMNPVEAELGPVDHIVVTPDPATLVVGEQQQFTATAYDENNTVIPGATFSWSTNLGVIIFTGLLFAQTTPGVGYVNATFGSVTGTANVTVVVGGIHHIDVTPTPVIVAVGNSQAFSASAYDIYNNLVTGVNFNWSTNVGTVDSGGLFTAQTIPGTGTVTATNDTVSGVADVDVVLGGLDTIVVAPSSVTLIVGDVQQFAATAFDQYGNQIPGVTFTWTTDAGSVDTTGRFTAQTVPNLGVVSASNNSVTGNASVNVTVGPIHHIEVVPRPVIVTVGDTQQFSATAYDKYNNVITGVGFSWGTSAGSVDSNGLFTAQTTPDIGQVWASNNSVSGFAVVIVIVGPIDTIVVTPDPVTLAVGETQQFTATAYDEYNNTITGVDFSWSTNVGTVDATGLFTAQTMPALGFVSATAGTNNGTAVVSVIEGDVDHIVLIPDPVTIAVGETQQFNATVYDVYNNTIPDPLLFWSTDVGVVNSTGFFTAQTIPGIGSVNVTCGSVTATADITVVIGVLHHIVVSPSPVIIVAGTSQQFSAAAYDAYNNLIVGVVFNWSSDVGVVDATGFFTAQTTTALGVVSATNGSVTGSSDVNVIPDAIVTIIVTPDPAIVVVGTNRQFTAIGYDQYVNEIPGVEFVWNTDVGTVNNTGFFTAQTTPSTGVIEATNSSITGVAIVSVVVGAVDHIVIIPDSIRIVVGDTQQFTATAYDIYNNVIPGVDFSWSADVGLVDSGGLFTAQITPATGVVEATNGSVTGASVVEVIIGLLDHIMVEPNPASVMVGETQQFTATAYDVYSNVISGVIFSWSTDLGIVNSTGYFTAFTTARPGLVNATSGSVTGSANVEVVAGAPVYVEVVPSPASVVVGTQQQFNATAYDAYNNVILNPTFFWNTNLGVVNYAGLFTAQSMPGVGYVNATCGSVTASAMVTIIVGNVSYISVIPNPWTMSADGEKQFSAIGRDLYFNVVPISPTWEVDGGGTVDATGYFIAAITGTWRIFANDSGISGNAIITIVPGVPVSIDVTPATATITADDILLYTATAYDSDGNSWDVTSGTVFTENDPKGTMIINAYLAGQVGTWTVLGNYIGLVDSASVTVIPGAAAFILLDSPSVVTSGEPFNVTVTIFDADSNVKTDYNGTITLSSSDPRPAILPPDHAFTGPDAGTFTFTNLILFVRPSQTVTASDTVNITLTDSDIIDVLSPFIQPEKIVPATAEPGELITYKIYYNNTGETIAANVWLNDTWPPELNFISASDGGNIGPGMIYWDFTDVLPGIWFVTVTFRVDFAVPNGALVTNWVFCNYTTTNGYLLPETKDDATVRIHFLPDVDVSKTVELVVKDIIVEPNQWGTCTIGGTLNYTVSITNLQPVDDSIDIEYNNLLGWNVDIFDENFSPLIDNNGNGIPDTGILSANGGTIDLIVNHTVPPTEIVGAEDILYVVGTSFGDPNVIDIARLNTTAVFSPPKEVVLVLDNSGSMQGQPIADLKVAAIGFVNQMEDRDYVAIIIFVPGGDRPLLLQGLTLLDPAGRATTIANINSLNANAATPIWDSIWDAIDMVDGSTNIPVVVAMTDGEDQASYRNNYKNDDAQEHPDGDPEGREGRPDGNPNDDYGHPFDPSGDGDGGICEAPMHVFTIGLSVTQLSERQLQEIGRTSDGGEYYYAPTSADLAQIYADIAAEISKIGGSELHGSKEAISAGDSLMYKIFYNNTGIGNAGDVWVNDSLPGCLILISTNASVPWTYVNGQYCWHFQNVPPGNHWFWIEVEIDNTVVDYQDIVNEVSVDYTDDESNIMGGNNDMAIVTVSEPTINIDKMTSTTVAEPGDYIRYTIFYNNTGSCMALFVWVNDSFDSHLDFVSDSAPVTPIINGNDYSWKIPGVMPGSYYFNVTVQVVDGTPGGTIISNQIISEYTNEDNVKHNKSSNSNIVNISIDNTEINVGKIVNEEITDPDKFLTYTIYFNNTGTDNADYVWINDTLPAEVTYVSDTSTSSPHYWSKSIFGRNCRFIFRNVDPGDHMFEITVRVNTGVPDGTYLVNDVDLDYKDDMGFSLPPSADDALSICGVINITKTSDRTIIPIGGASIVKLIIEIKNCHPTFVLNNIKLNDTLPSGVTWVGNVFASKGVWTWDGNMLNWTINDLQPLEIATISCDVSITPLSAGSYSLNNGAFAYGTTETGYLENATSNIAYVTAQDTPILDFSIWPGATIANGVDTFLFNVTNVGLEDGVFYRAGSDVLEITIPSTWGNPSSINCPADWIPQWIGATRTLRFFYIGGTDFNWPSGTTLTFSFDLAAASTLGQYSFLASGSIHDSGAVKYYCNKVLFVDVVIGPLNRIAIAPDPAFVIVGETQAFIAAGYDVYNNVVPSVEFIWWTNAGSIDATGVFTAQTTTGLGIVRASNGSVFSLALVYINPGPVDDIEVQPNPASVEVGATQLFTAIAYDEYGNLISNVDFNWWTNVGTIDANGLFTAKTTPGNGLVVAINGTVTDAAFVAVVPGAVDHIIVTPNALNITVGNSLMFTATAYDTYDNVIPSVDFNWTTTVGSIGATGFFTAQTIPGVGLVTATNGTISKSANVNVLVGPFDHITVTPNPANVRVGQVQVFMAVAFDAYNNALPGYDFTWDTDVGIVDSNGLFIAQITPGIGVVNATNGSITGSAVVNVTLGGVDLITVTPNPVTVTVGNTQQFTATAYDVFNNEIPGVGFIWTTNVGSVDVTGFFTAQTMPGSGLVTATNGTISGSASIEVIAGNISHIIVTPNPASVKVGETLQFTAEAYDIYNNVIPSMNFDWTTDVGSVDATGFFTAQTTPAVGTVTATNGTFSDSADVYVEVGEVARIDVTPTSATVTVGEFQQFTAIAYDVYNNEIPNAFIIWSTDVGVVNSTGYLTAQTSPVIGWVNATSGSGAVTGGADVEVVVGALDYILVTPDPINITVGGNQQFIADAYDVYNNVMPGVDFVWTTDIGSIDATGFFTAPTIPGTGIVTATNLSISGTANVEIIVGTIDHIILVPNLASVAAGDAQAFTAIAFDFYNNIIAGVVFNWTTDVGTVDTSGLFMAQTTTGVGTVTATNGSINGSANVNVIPGRINYIIVNPNNITVTVGDSQSFTATAYDQYDNVIPVVDFIWTSDVGTVDATGIFTAQTSPGIGTVTATNGTFSDSANVDVVIGALHHIIVSPDPATVTVGLQQQFTATAYDLYNNTIPSVTFNWTTDVGSVDVTGLFTAQTNTENGIVTATNDTVSGFATVTIVPGPVDHIIVAPDPLSIIVYGTEQFNASAYDAFNNSIPGATFTWSTDVGSVDATGLFTAQSGPGTGTVNATDGSIIGFASVDVIDVIIDHIVVSPDPSSVKAGETQLFTATAYDQFNNMIMGVDFDWTTNVGSVDATGLFTAQTTPGTGIVTATNGTVSGFAVVDVVPGPIDHITVTPDPADVTVNTTQLFTATAYDFYNNIISGVDFTWSTDVGVINASGIFTAQTVPGTGLVTAINGSVSGNATVNLVVGSIDYIIIDPYLVTISVGDTLLFTATAYDEFNNIITGVDFNWTTDVGTIDGTGLFTAQTVPELFGLVTAANGTVTDSAIVNVIPGPIDHIMVVPDPAYVEVGGTETFIAVAFDVYNNVISGVEFLWTTDVGIIDMDGLFTAQTTTAVGTVTATNSTVNGSAVVNIIPGPVDHIIVTPDPVVVTVGEQQAFTALAYDVHNNLIPNADFVWTTDVGSVDSIGLFTAQTTPGSGMVTATNGTVSDSAVLNVVVGALDHIIVTPDPAIIFVGDIQQFSAVAYDKYNNEITGVGFVWTTDVGFVDVNGWFTAQTTPGTGIVTATNLAINGSAAVTVVPGPISYIVVTPDPATVTVGGTQMFSATAYDVYNNLMSGVDFIWSTDVGSVDAAGLFTAQTIPGTGVVTATNRTVSGNADVTVVVGDVDSIIVTPDPATVVVGEFLQFTATAYDVYNNLVTDAIILWSTDVGFVNSTGYFTAQTTPGIGILTATCGTVSGSANVTVVVGELDHIIVTPASASIIANGVLQFSAEAFDKYNNTIIGVGFNWSTDVGSVDATGLFTAQSSPSVGTVNATNGSVSGFASVVVVLVAIEHIVVEPDPVSIMVGGTLLFRATAYDEFYNIISGVNFIWTTDVGTVDASGFFTAQTNSEVGVVTASNGTVSDSAVVNITTGLIDHIMVVPDPATVAVGDTEIFIAIAFDVYNNVISGVEFNWTTDVGTIGPTGFFTAQTTPAVGVVTATNGTVNYSAVVIVIPGPVDHIIVTPDPATVTVGDTQAFTAVAYDVYNNVIPGVIFVWTTDVGSINAWGLFTAQSTPGSGTVTATNGTVNYSAVVDVVTAAFKIIVVTPGPVPIWSVMNAPSPSPLLKINTRLVTDYITVVRGGQS